MLASIWLATVPAFGADIDTLVQAWSLADDDGAATHVAFDADGHLVVSGWTADGGGSLAYLESFDITGNTVWSYTTDPGPLAVADNRWHDFAIDSATGNLALCGQRGGAQSDLDWLVEVIEPSLSPVWTVAYGGPAASPVQSCHGIAWSTSLLTAGSIFQNDTVLGQWILWQLDPDTGLIEWPGTVDFTAVAFDEDAAADVAAFPDGTAAVIGRKAGSPMAVVQRRDRTDVLWDALMPDDLEVSGVVVEPVSGRAVVVGTLDTDSGSDAWIGSFNQDSGTPQLPVWEATWSVGAPSGATTIALDGAGEVLVGGWVEAGGGPYWRVARYEVGSGKPLEALDIPDATGWPLGVALSGDLLAVVGTDDGSSKLGVRVFGVDGDGDGAADVVDGCPTDTGKTDPGVCGCTVPDVDSDGDGALNCEEECGADPDKFDPGICGCDVADDDSDGDGTADCDDGCEDDASKADPGVCGCGVPDSDDDGDGYLVCQDQCPDTPPGVPVDAVGCELGDEEPDTGDTGGGGKAPDLSAGCGCAAAGSPGPATWVALFFLLVMARRRSGVA